MNTFDYEAAAQERNRRDKALRNAAPDLLAALTILVWQMDLMDDLPDEIEQMLTEAHAAIAKAKARGEAA